MTKSLSQARVARQPNITAVICTYNRYRTLGPAIQSLVDQSLDKQNYDIIVVDNSPDAEYSKSYSRKFRATSNLSWMIEKTPGLSNARNVGVSRARSEFVAFMDDDAVADPSWLEEIVSGFKEFGQRASVVGGRVDPIWEAPRPKWLHDDFLGYLSVVDWGGSTRIAGQGEWLAGTNISFRIKDLQTVGGFSTELGRKRDGLALLSNEETDVCERLKALGRYAIYAPAVKVGHRAEQGRLTQDWFRRRVVWQAVSDFMREGTSLLDKAPQYWTSVVEFVNGLPPRDRSLRALYVPVEDALMFKAQLSALYNYTVALLSGFAGIEV